MSNLQWLPGSCGCQFFYRKKKGVRYERQYGMNRVNTDRWYYSNLPFHWLYCVLFTTFILRHYVLNSFLQLFYSIFVYLLQSYTVVTFTAFLAEFHCNYFRLYAWILTIVFFGFLWCFLLVLLQQCTFCSFLVLGNWQLCLPVFSCKNNGDIIKDKHSVYSE